ncbi:MAG: nitrilase-related carbon-nitrogen hydrolase, partial [Pseudomonadota bacterium]
MDQVTIALAQVNPTVGDIQGNIALARRVRAQTKADLIVFPELFISGYPPEDLVLKPFFMDLVEQAVRDLATDTADGGPAMVVGAPWRDGDKRYNAVLLLDGGDVVTQRYKVELPNYGVFDEQRVFSAGSPSGPVSFRGFRLGLMVCEDCWFEQAAECLAESGAECLIVSNGSPYESDKQDLRMNVAVSRVVETGLPLAFVNQIGGQDELVFDGGSFVLDAERNLIAQAPMFEEHIMLTTWTRAADGTLTCGPGTITPDPEGLEATYRAMCLGLVDYVNKNGFPGVILGLS